jgi:hypothetical protein
MNDMEPDEPNIIYENAIYTNLGEQRDILQWMTRVSKFCKIYGYNARNCGMFSPHTAII